MKAKSKRLEKFLSEGKGGKKIVLATFGSLGDIYPYMALAKELKRRGHCAVIAASEEHRPKIEWEDIDFYALRPKGLAGEKDGEFIKLMMDCQRGFEYIICYLLMPHLRESYSDLMAAVKDADLLISHPLILTASLVAEKTGIPWVSTVLAPSCFMSVYDEPKQLIAEVSPYQKALALMTRDSVLRGLRALGWLWSAPVRQLRAELGLEWGGDPVFEGQFSPRLVLGLFSQVFAKMEPDWPTQTCVTGFAFYNHENGQKLSPELEKFLHSGPAPIVFTLGSTAVLTAGNFYLEGAKAAHELGYRAVLLMGKAAYYMPPDLLPAGVVAFDYAPHSQIFSHAAAIVHHGGVGTTGEALRAGRPQLIVPFNYDQPDNAARVVRLGVGRTIGRERCTASALAGELQQLLGNSSYIKRCGEVGIFIKSEKGVVRAVDAIEAQLML